LILLSENTTGGVGEKREPRINFMNPREVKRCEMFDRVVAFGQANATDFLDSSKAAELFARMKEVVARIAVASNSPEVDQSTSVAVLLDALRIDLNNIVRTASEIGIDAPGFAERFLLPANLKPSALTTAASQVLVELGGEGVSARFVGYELPETFVSDLADDLDELESIRDLSDNAEIGRSDQAVSLGSAIQSGLLIVGKLNAIMHNKYTRQPEKLLAWRKASYTERAAQREAMSAITIDSA